jgi:hypothetical protein
MIRKIPLRLAGLIVAAALASPAHAEPLIGLQKALRAAEAEASAHDKLIDRAKADTLKAVAALGAKGNTAAVTALLAAAQQREQAAEIGALQSTAALRRARQALTEAVTDAIEQGEAIERAAARAGHGDVAPSVSDLLACDGPDCVPVSAREHAALVLMGAVPPGFDFTKWLPETPGITALAYDPEAPPFATLRQAAARAAEHAQAAQKNVAAAQGDLQTRGDGKAAESYTRARTEAEAAQAERLAADERLVQAARRYADAGRALKRAALLAGDGYALKPDGRRACRAASCLSAESMEAAAFLVLGAAEDSRLPKHLAPFIAPSAARGFVFR